ncbi:GNAT family N-acetyltransferase [Actinoplanes sp. NPDC051851]|uniref:GNAT family N-acetyltransferase n=1 Tax=Actinoplanes sp. NPDC051851 TaxID=3154753 RepID=UPI00342445E1
MSEFSIRPAVPADAPSVVALIGSVHPYLVRGEPTTRRMISDPPPGEDWAAFVAEERGGPVGWVSTFRNVRSAEPDFGQVSLLSVDPGHRRRGIGDALFAAAVGHLRARGIRRASATSTPDALDFARRHGFQPTREIRYSALDLAGLAHDAPAVETPAGPERPAAAGRASVGLPEGVRLVAMGEVGARELFHADTVAATDEPGDTPQQAVAFETWRYDIWEHPGMDRDASTVAVGETGILAFSLLVRDRERVWSDMTATVPQWRGRGLARMVKSEALRRAAAAGVTVAYTSNDESNVAMLAVNDRLGYRPVATQFSCAGDL